MKQMLYTLLVVAASLYGMKIGYNHGFHSGVIMTTELIEYFVKISNEDIQPYRGGKI